MARVINFTMVKAYRQTGIQGRAGLNTVKPLYL